MKMMLLLVSAVVLLVSPAVVSPAAVPHNPVTNLESIIELAEKYNKTVTEEFFVEDVTHLAEGGHGCQDKFFCKVHHILHQHEKFGKNNQENELVRNLRMYIKAKNKNCTEILHNVTHPGVQSPIPVLMDHLIQCSKNVNLSGTR